MNPIAKTIIARITLLTVAVFLTWTALSIYRIVRSERVNTRISVRLDGSDHELIAALPAGRYQIHFTAAPNVAPQAATSAVTLLPAQITTALLRGDSDESIVAPNDNENIAFIISEQDAFRPSRLRVAIARKQPCQIYMNIGPSF